MRDERKNIPYQRQNTNVPYQPMHNIKRVEKLMLKANPYITSILRLLIDSHSVLAREILRNVAERHTKK